MSKFSTLESRKLKQQGLKYCPKCQIPKEFEKFSKNKASRDGLASHCLNCNKILVNIYDNDPKIKKQKHIKYINNRCRLRNNHLKRRFGLTLSEYRQKLINQNYRCAICGLTQIENGKDLAVDHNHNTGQVRDLLCGRCNAAVGFVKENVDIAEKLVYYIQKWS